MVDFNWMADLSFITNVLCVSLLPGLSYKIHLLKICPRFSREECKEEVRGWDQHRNSCRHRRWRFVPPPREQARVPLTLAVSASSLVEATQTEQISHVAQMTWGGEATRWEMFSVMAKPFEFPCFFCLHGPMEKSKWRSSVLLGGCSSRGKQEKVWGWGHSAVSWQWSRTLDTYCSRSRLKGASEGSFFQGLW